MWKVNLCIFIGLTLIPNLVTSVAIRDSYLKALDANRRVISPPPKKSFFLSGLYNLEGKPHDRGADYGLTSDVYTKPNPFYTKRYAKKTDEKTPAPVYPVYIHNNSIPQSTDAVNNLNNSVTQDVAPSSSDESYDVIPSSYDSKSNSYSAPSSSYGAPTYSVQSVQSSSYGVPSSSYGSPGSSSYYPHSSYGSPHSSYGPPSHYPVSPPMSSPMPEAQKSHSEWFMAKILKKFDIILMSKILLKLFIFKKIVKFIGIICLLMFIPILKKKFEDHTDSDEDEERRIQSLDAYANVDFHLKEIANFAFTAIEGFSASSIPWCVGQSELYCRVQYMLDQVDLRYQGGRILGLWFPKLLPTTAPTTEEPSEEQHNFNDFITESTDTNTVEDEDSNADANETRLRKFKSVFRK